MEIRASDLDRERTVAALQRHTGAGRLTLDEFAQRVDTACAARTVGELGAVLHDLPAEPAEDPPPAEAAGRRDLVLVFAVAVLTLLLLVGYIALSR